MFKVNNKDTRTTPMKIKIRLKFILLYVSTPFRPDTSIFCHILACLEVWHLSKQGILMKTDFVCKKKNYNVMVRLDQASETITSREISKILQR